MDWKWIEFAIAAVSTGKIFPRIFSNEKDAENFRRERADPNNWKIVSRTLWQSDWE